MIFIIDSIDKSKIEKYSDLTWIYIGSSGGIGRIGKIIKQDKRRFIAKDIENITKSVRGNFIDFIAKVSNQQKDKVLWYSSRMASKSISQTPIFHQYIYLKLLEELSHEQSKDILIITDDKEFLENAKKIRLDNLKILNNRPFCENRIYERIRGYLRVLIYISPWLIYKFLGNRRLDKFNIFVHTWIDNRTFSNLPEFTDFFLGDLGNFLKEKGYNVGRLTILRLHLKHLFKLNKYFNNIIYPMSYLRLTDLIRVIFTRFTCTINNDALADIKDLRLLNVLLKHEIAKENTSKIYLYYLLLFYSYKNLSSKINMRASFIYPFENQPWEKMFSLAFGRFNRIAYQHSTIPENWLDYRISRYDDGALNPKVILTAGDKWTSFLKEYYPNAVIREAGAIRYRYLFEKQKGHISKDSHNIIVALPISPSTSLSLQKQILNSLQINGLQDYSVKIKPHPYLPASFSFKDMLLNFKNCRFVDSDITELLKDCKLLVTSESTVAFESIFLGIKTLYFIPEELSLGLEYFIRDDLFIAYEENFPEILKEALNSRRYPNIDAKEYFSYPDYGIFLDHLQNN